MPFNSHSYLVSQGWSGTGSGLRAGAIARPLPTPLKRDLAGVGKDRDDAFPFWDHVFTTAAESIKVKIHCDEEESDEDGDEDGEEKAAVSLQRTQTGLLSNRRPHGSSTTSGTSTPILNVDPQTQPVSAKRAAAHRSLYSRFSRGVILASDDYLDDLVPETTGVKKRKREHAPDGLGQIAEKRKRKKETLETRDERKKMGKSSKKTRPPIDVDHSKTTPEEWTTRPINGIEEPNVTNASDPVEANSTSPRKDERSPRKKKSKRKRPQGWEVSTEALHCQ